jgi:hypothetical protein
LETFNVVKRSVIATTLGVLMALVAASNDVRAIDKKAQQNVGKTEFGKVPMSPKKRFGKGLHCNNM